MKDLRRVGVPRGCAHTFWIKTLNLDALLRSNGFKFVFGITYHLEKEMRLKRLKMKNPPLSQATGKQIKKLL